MDTYYPDHPTPHEVASIHGELTRQWAAIQEGWPWDPGRLPEAILAILEGPLAWRRIPFLPAFDPGPYAAWLDVWHRPDGFYLTLSPEGAAELGVRPVGLTSKRRALAAAEGETDARGDVLTGDTALMDGEWLAVVYLPDPKHPDRGKPLPLSRFRADFDPEDWRIDPQEFGGEPMESLDAIGAESIVDPHCESETEKIFSRPREPDRIGRAMRQFAG